MQTLATMLSDPDFIVSVAYEKVTYPADTIILDEGSDGQDLFVIKSGEVQVSYSLDDAYDQPARLTRLSVNDIFGELSLFDSGPRSAQVQALTECEVYKFAGPILLSYLDANPDRGYFIVRDILRHLISQMRQTNLRTKMALQMYFHEHQDD